MYSYAFVTTLHLQASADAAASCKPVQLEKLARRKGRARDNVKIN